MAALGSIGRNFGKFYIYNVPNTAFVDDANPVRLDIPTDKTISGIVNINSTPTGGVDVWLFLRKNMDLLNHLVTQSDGSYAFKYLNSIYDGEYLVLFKDPQNGSPFNYTLARDHLAAG